MSVFHQIYGSEPIYNGIVRVEAPDGEGVDAVTGVQGENYEILSPAGQTIVPASVNAKYNKAFQDLQLNQGKGGYEFTAGFKDRTTGAAGVSDSGSNVFYSADMASSGMWLRFGFDLDQQVTNDNPYWSDPVPADASGVGLFGGSYMPPTVDSLFDFSFTGAAFTPAASTSEGQPYTEASGSFDFTECRPGDLALVRFDFNILPQVQNTTLEVGLIWQTRDANNNPTFTFALPTQPIFFGVGTVGNTYLNRPIISAYFASQEDVNARALLAIRADNQIQIQPLTTLSIIVR